DANEQRTANLPASFVTPRTSSQRRSSAGEFSLAAYTNRYQKSHRCSVSSLRPRDYGPTAPALAILYERSEKQAARLKALDDRAGPRPAPRATRAQSISTTARQRKEDHFPTRELLHHEPFLLTVIHRVTLSIRP